MSAYMEEPTEFSTQVVSDGHGNEWVTCGHAMCNLQVVRPGKAQCDGYCNELSGFFPEPDPEEEWRS